MGVLKVQANEERRQTNTPNDLRLSYMLISMLKCKYLANPRAIFSSWLYFCHLAEANENSVI